MEWTLALAVLPHLLNTEKYWFSGTIAGNKTANTHHAKKWNVLMPSFDGGGLKGSIIISCQGTFMNRAHWSWRCLLSIGRRNFIDTDPYDSEHESFGDAAYDQWWQHVISRIRKYQTLYTIPAVSKCFFLLRGTGGRLKNESRHDELRDLVFSI